MYIAGTLNVSKKICAACSRFEFGFRGASVSKTGCCTGRQSQRGGKTERGSGSWEHTSSDKVRSSSV